MSYDYDSIIQAEPSGNDTRQYTQDRVDDMTDAEVLQEVERRCPTALDEAIAQIREALFEHYLWSEC